MTFLLFLSSFSSIAQAHFPPRNSQGSSVALGITTGPILNTSTRGTEASFSGGFYTDIPLLDTFHITPSTTVYRYNNQSQTDISINFKFVVPANKFKFMGGVTTGLTSNDALVPHVGVFGGASFQFVSNLDWFVNVAYLHQFSQPTSHSVGITTGPLFRFSR